jgi:hypothetical protein
MSERRQVRLGGPESEDPNLSPEARPIHYYGKSRPDDYKKKRKRGGFFARRGSMIFFVDLVIVAIIALTLYPMYGRKDRGRWEGYTFTLDAERLEEGIYFDLFVKAPGREGQIHPGIPFAYRFSTDSGESLEEVDAVLPVTVGAVEHQRAFLRLSSPEKVRVATATLSVSGETFLLRLGLP